MSQTDDGRRIIEVMGSHGWKDRQGTPQTPNGCRQSAPGTWIRQVFTQTTAELVHGITPLIEEACEKEKRLVSDKVEQQPTSPVVSQNTDPDEPDTAPEEAVLSASSCSTKYPTLNVQNDLGFPRDDTLTKSRIDPNTFHY